MLATSDQFKAPAYSRRGDEDEEKPSDFLTNPMVTAPKPAKAADDDEKTAAFTTNPMKQGK